MYKPKYLTRLMFVTSEVVCLGEQLLELLIFLESLLPPHIWYGCHVWASSLKENIFSNIQLEAENLEKIGDIEFLKKQVSCVDQFFSGVFFAVRKDVGLSKSIKAHTEDKKFRPLDINDVIIEIRAFDTTCFEIYTEDPSLIGQIAEKYSERVITAEGYEQS